MGQLTLDLPETLLQWLAGLASEQKKSVEEVVVEQLTSARDHCGETLAERYQKFIKESGLFREVPPEEKRRYQPVSEERLRELAAKLGSAGPLSTVIIEERGER